MTEHPPEDYDPQGYSQGYALGGKRLCYCRHCGEYIIQAADGVWEADCLIGRENYTSQAIRRACDRSAQGHEWP